MKSLELLEKDILQLLEKTGPEGLRPRDISALIGLGRSDLRLVNDILGRLLAEDRLGRQDRAYVFRAKGQPAQARITGVLHIAPHGVGFVDRGEAFDDVKVTPACLAGALDGDTVQIQLWDGGRREHGQVVDIVQRGRNRVVGNLAEDRQTGELYLRPDDPRLPERVPVDAMAVDAAVGQAVLGTIVRYPERLGDAPRVEIARVLGEAGVLITEVTKCVAGAGVDEEFDAEVQAEAEALSLDDIEQEAANREDLRSLHFVTIDPMSARDFDDAVALESLPDGLTRLWVAVADVSHYVTEDSAIDREARRRGCSLYLPDRAIHMLPEILSAGVCSLRPHEDRLAMVVRLDINRRGKVVADDCLAAVIHSRGRLDYHGVAAAMAGDFSGNRARYAEHMELLEGLHRVAGALRRSRLERGSLDLDLPEAQVVLDADDPALIRDVVQSRPDPRIKQAYNLIEEMMVAANEAVGRRFVQAQETTIWRVHPKPAPEAVAQLAGWLMGYGVDTCGPQLTRRKGLATVPPKIADHRAQRPLSYLLLRTLKQALYSTENIGHFGLASTSYLHFTSPIRRYPDLLVHRLLKRILRQAKRPAGCEVTVELRGKKKLACQARDAALAERRAVEVEREVRRLYAAEVMRDRLGDRLWGTVTGLGRAGLFVALDSPAAEGLVAIDSFGPEAEFDQERLRLLDPRAGRIFSLGDRLEVKVIEVSVARRRVDLRLCPEEEAHQPDPNVSPSEYLGEKPWQKAKRQARQGRNDRNNRGFRRGGGGRKAGDRGRRKGKRR